MLLPSGNPFKCYEEIWSLQSMILTINVLKFPPLAGGCSEILDAFNFFFKKRKIVSSLIVGLMRKKCSESTVFS